MGFLDDLEKALNDFDNWITDIQMAGEEVREDIDWDEYYAERPLETFEIVEDDFFAPIADFFENLDKGTDEIVTDFVGEVLGAKKEEVAEEPETWYAYYWTIDGGYFGSQVLSDESGVFYADSDDREWDVFDRIINDVGQRYSGGQGYEMDPSVDSPYEVDKEDVPDWEKLDG